MTIHAINKDGEAGVNTILYTLESEPLRGICVTLSGEVKIPKATSPGQWHIVFLCANKVTGEAWFEVFPRGQRPAIVDAQVVSKVIGAWGTRPRSTALMPQRQTNHIVQFAYDADYDQDYARPGDTEWVWGDGQWKYRGNYGGWPHGYCHAVYLRGECGRQPTKGPGLAQMNFASKCEEGTSKRPNLSFITQVKGDCYRVASGSGGAAAVSLDWMRVVIDPAIGQICVMVNKDSVGRYLNSGFELTI